MANGLKSESSVRGMSKAFDTAYEAIFGNHEPIRGRWWVDPETGVLVDHPPVAPEARLQINTDTHYEGIRATDGTPLESRRVHREYMHANGLTIADDFKETWKEARRKRERGFEDPDRKYDIARAISHPKKAVDGPIIPD